MEWSPENCSIARTLGIIGEKWTLIVLRDVFSGLRRFNDLAEYSGVPRQVLTNRLSVLVREGILRRDTYQEPGSRPRPEYRLTEKGLDIYRILIALREWGDRYVADPEGPLLQQLHRDCGAPITLSVRCAEGHEIHDPREVIGRPGPGARRRDAKAASATK